MIAKLAMKSIALFLLVLFPITCLAELRLNLVPVLVRVLSY